MTEKYTYCKCHSNSPLFIERCHRKRDWCYCSAREVKPSKTDLRYSSLIPLYPTLLMMIKTPLLSFALLDINCFLINFKQQENLKFTGKSGDDIQPTTGDLPYALLHHHYAFLPATFDPSGTVGPALTGFLWSPTTAISPTLTSHLPLHPDARHVHGYCYEHIAYYNLFTHADTGWQSSHPNQWFTSHYST